MSMTIAEFWMTLNYWIKIKKSKCLQTQETPKTGIKQSLKRFLHFSLNLNKDSYIDSGFQFSVYS